MATLLDCEYKTDIDDATVYGLSKVFGVPDVDIDTGKQTAYVDWKLEPEARSWGVKSISIYATKVVCSVEWEVYTDDLTEEEKAKLIAAGGREYRNDTIGGTIEVVSNEKWNGNEWKIDSDFGLSEGGMCCPQDAEIDFESMTITIS